MDDIIARELDGADLEFAWTPTETIDPVAQETMLSSYTSRGILTLNEARAALGRAPLADPAADRPMALTGAGYVALGQTVGTPIAKRAAYEKLDKIGDWDEDKHPRWPAGSDEHQGGRFAPADAGRTPAGRVAMTRRCKKEWGDAAEQCDNLLNLPEFHPDRALLGGHTTIGGCAPRFVSDACGGNKVA